MPDRAQILAQLAEEERSWAAANTEGGDADHWGLIQYPLDRFADLCDTAAGYLSRHGCHAADIEFLEVGCGIGTKAAYAKLMHGISVYGIDRVPAHAALAKQHGIIAQAENAADFKSYGKFDIVYVNHPFRDPHMQLQLDWKIQREMRPGALLIGVNQAYGSQPPMDWLTIFEPPGWPVHGVWQKP